MRITIPNKNRIVENFGTSPVHLPVRQKSLNHGLGTAGTPIFDLLSVFTMSEKNGLTMPFKTPKTAKTALFDLFLFT